MLMRMEIVFHWLLSSIKEITDKSHTEEDKEYK
jgi:hypothetical protein